MGEGTVYLYTSIWPSLFSPLTAPNMGCKSSREPRPQFRQVPMPRGPQDPPRDLSSSRRSVTPSLSARSYHEDRLHERYPCDPAAAQRRQQPERYSQVVATPSSTRSGRRVPRGNAQQLLSAHSSDDDLVLICVDCGAEILDPTSGERCPKTGKAHC